MTYTHVHIVGVGGCATSGLAQLLLSKGIVVSGSDCYESATIGKLRALGVSVELPHSASALSRARAAAGDDSKIKLVYSPAIEQENPERVEASNTGIEEFSYPQFMGQFLEQFESIAIAGSHGKTTTTAMLASIFFAARRDPSVLVGGICSSLVDQSSEQKQSTNVHCGSGSEFIVEACEYKRSFHSIHPMAAVITNIDHDHPEIYANQAGVVESFQVFAEGLRPCGLLIVPDDPILLEQLPKPKGGHKRSFGFRNSADDQAVVKSLGEEPSFDWIHEGEFFANVTLQTPGRHSISNALAAAAMAFQWEISVADIVKGLESFKGVDRRFQHWGQLGGVDWVDDYAHHPTEIRSLIETARERFPSQKLWALFQPHQLGRLQAFGSAFAEALSQADEIAVLPAYSVRECKDEFPHDLTERFAKLIGAMPHQHVHYFSSFEQSLAQMPSLLNEGDVCLVIGAGDVIEHSADLRSQYES